MARGNRILVMTSLVIALPFIVSELCSSKEDVAPCTCMEIPGKGIVILCDEIDIEDLARVASNLRGRNVEGFDIRDSKLGSIPYDIFKGVKLSLLTITKSTLSALTDRGEAFVGQEDHLKELRIWNCDFENEWDWAVLRNLKKLTHLTIADTIHQETVGTDLMKASVPNLESIFFHELSISFVSDHAFDSYKNLRDLTLTNNKIKNVKRTMLPNPALELTFLSLSNNLIEHFPKDMFTNMPNLIHLQFASNKILVLDEKTFSPVWEQLQELVVQGNKLLCDCGMSWLLEKRTPAGLHGACELPLELKGKHLIALKAKDFKCYQ